jgi:hypothetical protein
MVPAVERVRSHLLRAARALEAAGVPYAVADGHAVAAWVATVGAAIFTGPWLAAAAVDRDAGAINGMVSE